MITRRTPKMAISTSAGHLLTIASTIRAALFVFALLLVVAAGQLWSRPATSRHDSRSNDEPTTTEALNSKHQHRHQQHHLQHEHLNNHLAHSKQYHNNKHHRHKLIEAEETNKHEHKYQDEPGRKSGRDGRELAQKSLQETDAFETIDLFRLKRELALQADILSRLKILESYDALLNEFALRYEKLDDLGAINASSLGLDAIGKQATIIGQQQQQQQQYQRLMQNASELQPEQLAGQLSSGRVGQRGTNHERSPGEEDRERMCLLKLPFQLNRGQHQRQISDFSGGLDYCHRLMASSLDNNAYDSKINNERQFKATGHLQTNRIPPYIENLYNRIAGQASSRREAVRLMPYQSLAMRSFRQPEIIAPKNNKMKQSYIKQEQEQDEKAGQSGSGSNVRSASNINSVPDTGHSQSQSELESERIRSNGQAKTKQTTRMVPNFVVELSLLEEEQQEDDERIASAGADPSNPDRPFKFNRKHKLSEREPDGLMEDDKQLMDARQRATEPANENRAGGATAASERMHVIEGRDRKRGSQPWPIPLEAACNLNERLLAAERRSKLCYWFPISDPMAARLNGSTGTGTAAQTSERLVEAELHLFKLKPLLRINNYNSNRRPISQQVQIGKKQLEQQARSNAEHQEPSGTKKRQITSKLEAENNQDDRPHDQGHSSSLKIDRGTSRDSEIHGDAIPGDSDDDGEISRSLSPSNLYHLKTNLLEVSLFQVLPPDRNATSPPSNTELPLRLLDIRRIDLHSTGWEAFYVKRAVEDWIRDPSLNLGLVIKTKSMFDEPIRIGLIRFADLYDSTVEAGEEYEFSEGQGYIPGSPDDDKDDDSEREQRMRPSVPDVDHQPTLIVYTTSTS